MLPNAFESRWMAIALFSLFWLLLSSNIVYSSRQSNTTLVVRFVSPTCMGDAAVFLLDADFGRRVHKQHPIRIVVMEDFSSGCVGCGCGSVSIVILTNSMGF